LSTKEEKGSSDVYRKQFTAEQFPTGQLTAEQVHRKYIYAEQCTEKIMTIQRKKIHRNSFMTSNSPQLINS
jgi:hypothetical protein